MASALIEAVVGKLGNQASLLHFREDFEWLIKEFTKLKGYLQHEHHQNESVKKWLAEVQDIGLDAEDMVEECAVQPLYGDSIGADESIIMGGRIKELKNRMESIMKNAADLNLVQRQPVAIRAEEWKKSGLVEMELLSHESWNLFCLHAFPEDPQNGPSEEVDEVAHQVERECGRIPLAIKTVAASMAGHKSSNTWKSKLQQLQEVSDHEDPIRPILRLSYDALPAELKPCFLYFSFFGEDVEIDAEYLIYLWMGEGFIPEGKEPWSTGWLYLEKLSNLCLVEVNQDVGASEKLMGWSRDRELKKTCKIHDLQLDLIKYICKKKECAFTVEKASGCRRILLAKAGLDDAAISGLQCPPYLRTLSLSGNTINELPSKSVSGVEALRVIDLRYTRISVLPSCIGNLKLVRVLNLSNTGFTEVPECVRNLKSLWFLNVSTCPLPKWIGDLKCLQHLHVERADYSPEISTGVSKLLSLRVLRSESRNLLVLKDVAKLIQLEELRIDANEEEKKSLEEGVLAQLVNMRHLTIKMHLSSTKRFEPFTLKAMKNLEYLALYEVTVTRWICECANLRVLKLKEVSFGQFPALDTMPNLTRLEIDSGQFCFGLPESFGKSGAFPQLRSFVITNSSPISKKFPDHLQDGAMPLVVVFRVYNCGTVKKIPEGFEHLRNLKLLDFRHTFAERGLEEGGEYWEKIKAKNPHITMRL